MLEGNDRGQHHPQLARLAPGKQRLAGDVGADRRTAQWWHPADRFRPRHRRGGEHRRHRGGGGVPDGKAVARLRQGVPDQLGPSGTVTDREAP
ncbi:MAG: hypothetical protein NVS9B1_14770 [Candidatus Dormibacteraceae bacterium]